MTEKKDRKTKISIGNKQLQVSDRLVNVLSELEDVLQELPENASKSKNAPVDHLKKE